MKEVSSKDKIFGIFSGLIVFWLGMYAISPRSRLSIIVLPILLCLLAGALPGYFSRTRGWFWGGVVIVPFSLLSVIIGMLLLSPFWVFTPLAVFGISYNFSPPQAAIAIIGLGIIALILGAIGGFLGEKLSCRLHK